MSAEDRPARGDTEASEGVPPLLAGVRVVDLTQFLAGPYGSLTLSSLGADVIKVEDPDHPDDARGVGATSLSKDVSLYFASLNWGKRSIALRYTTDAGRAVLFDLVRTADVVLSNFRGGTLSKWGLDHAAFSAAKPDIITCSLTGFGESGPLAQQPGYDYTVQAMAGVMSLAGEPGGIPVKAGISYVDHIGGLSAALAICAALYRRNATGQGCAIDQGLLDTQMSMLTYLAAGFLYTGRAPGRLSSSAHPTLVPAQIFHCSDGYLTLFVGNDRMWSRLVQSIGDARLDDPCFACNAERLARRDEVVGILQDILKDRSANFWVDVLRRSRVACAKVNTVGEALSEPQVAARALIGTAENPVYGSYRHVVGPVRTQARKLTNDGAPVLGQDTVRILQDIGYESGMVEKLMSDGTVAEAVL